MANFKKFAELVQKQFETMVTYPLFVTDIEKDVLWDTYLNSFAEGTNEMFRERREHDCSSCRQFIKAVGNLVAIVDNKLVSIWDVAAPDQYGPVSEVLSNLVKSAPVRDVFFYLEKEVGTKCNRECAESGEIITWNHFQLDLPKEVVLKNEDIPAKQSDMRTTKDVFKRSLDEITLEAAEIVLELIEQKSLYRGEEHKRVIELFIEKKTEYDQLDSTEKDNYCWAVSKKVGPAVRIRSTVIGTLLVDISEGKHLDAAVGSFEAKVAPTNYKRPTALITKGMIQKAEQKVQELGISDALQRRFAVTEDITINNVLFADRQARKEMSVFDELIAETPANLKKFDKTEEIDMETFLSSILPKAENIEVLVENRHTPNFMNLIAPIDSEAKPIFKWDNNFCWAYQGEVADSMKERVKKMGGNVHGVLRFSIQWNENNDNSDDLDAHCIEPNKNLIHFPNKGHRHPSTGMLDVDIINPAGKVAVENITWTDLHKMQEGRYTVLVHCYSQRRGTKSGFSAEIEYDGMIYSYAYNKPLRQDQKIVVAEFDFDHKTGLKFINSLPSSTASKEIWGIPTQQFRRVSMIMNSPNHWDGETTGNKHYFFMLENCKNPDKARGFFNEFLSEDLREHRKVFEVLGSKMKTQPSDVQLSGLGFSSTQRNHVICRVSGSFTRTLKITV